MHILNAPVLKLVWDWSRKKHVFWVNSAAEFSLLTESITIAIARVMELLSIWLMASHHTFQHGEITLNLFHIMIDLSDGFDHKKSVSNTLF